MVDRCITIHVPLDNVVHNPCLLYEVMNAYIRAFLRLDYNLSRRQTSAQTDRHLQRHTYTQTDRHTKIDVQHCRTPALLAPMFLFSLSLFNNRTLLYVYVAIIFPNSYMNFIPLL